jgi:hypothetical protein
MNKLDVFAHEFCSIIPYPEIRLPSREVSVSERGISSVTWKVPPDRMRHVAFLWVRGRYTSKFNTYREYCIMTKDRYGVRK